MKFIHPKKFKFRAPLVEEFTFIQKLLLDSKLPSQDIHPANQYFIIAENEGEVIGCCGFEQYGEYGLFRSLAVSADYRSLGIGRLLTDKIMDLAKGKGINTFYLLTTTAEDFFKKQSWNVTDRVQVQEEISQTTEFLSVCPSTATCMMYRL